MAIDWSLAKQPDIIGNAYASMRQGEAAGREQQARNAYATYAVDPEAGIKALMPYDPAAATQLSTARRQEKRQDAADALDMSDRQKREASERAGMLASYAQSLKALPPEQRKAALANDAPQLIERGLTAEMIAGFDPSDQNIDKVTNEALGIKDKLVLDLKKQTFQAGREDAQFNQTMETKKFGHTVAKDNASLGIDRARLGLEGQRVAIARQSAAQAGEGVDKTTRATEANLRKEFNALPDVKNYRTVATQAAAVKRLAAAPPSANGDIAMVYAVMKSYDPTSVVRETEFATAQNAAGVPDKIRNQFNSLRNGQRLNPKQRAEMAATVAGFADTYKQRFDTVANEYRSYASDYSGNPDRVVTVPQDQPAPVAKPPAELGARQGAGGKFYAPDPNRPKSFPEVALGADGVWRMKSANGQILKFVP